jgi:hypothetical protein
MWFLKYSRHKITNLPASKLALQAGTLKLTKKYTVLFCGLVL